MVGSAACSRSGRASIPSSRAGRTSTSTARSSACDTRRSSGASTRSWTSRGREIPRDPVKRYSSGMYVRLAFAVAAHLETEILAIDEVLAVGDAEFQAKSLAKMRDVARDGRTVLYVSHQAQTVSALCTRAIYLDQGKLTYAGNVEDALAEYRNSFTSFHVAQQDASRRAGTGELRFTEATIAEETMEPTEDKVIEFAVNANPDLVGSYFISCHVNDMNGNIVVQCDSRLVGLWLDPTVPSAAR
ncbi:hypothetical protein NKG05_19810 [Oerskovia sp. M15]